MEKKKRLGVGGNLGRGPGAVSSSLSSLERGLCTLNWLTVTDGTSWRVFEYLVRGPLIQPISPVSWHLSMYFSIIRGSLFSPFRFISSHVFMECILTYTLFLSALSNCCFPLAAFPVTLYILMASLKQQQTTLEKRFCRKQRVDLSMT